MTTPALHKKQNVYDKKAKWVYKKSKFGQCLTRIRTSQKKNSHVGLSAHKRLKFTNGCFLSFCRDICCFLCLGEHAHNRYTVCVCVCVYIPAVTAQRLQHAKKTNSFYRHLATFSRILTLRFANESLVIEIWLVLLTLKAILVSSVSCVAQSVASSYLCSRAQLFLAVWVTQYGVPFVSKYWWLKHKVWWYLAKAWRYYFSEGMRIFKQLRVLISCGYLEGTRITTSLVHLSFAVTW